MTQSDPATCSSACHRSLRPGFAACLVALGLSAAPCSAVPSVTDTGTAIGVDNGLTSFSVSKSNGRMTSLVLGAQELMGGGGTRGYFSANVGDVGVSGSTYWEMGFAGTSYSYSTGPDFVDVALFYPATASMPYDVTQHYVLRDGETGFHVFANVEHTTAMAPKRIEELRFVLRGSPSLFTHHWVADDRFAIMPTPAELDAGTTVQDATDRLPPGTAYEAETGKDVYTKYDWSIGMDEIGVHGFYGDNYAAWIVQPNKETLMGGPTKQELTVHQTTTTPVLLGMLVGQHYGTAGSVETPGNFDRLYGPMYVHLNSGPNVAELETDAAGYNAATVHQAFYDSLGMPGWVDTADRSQVGGWLHFVSGGAADGAVVVLADIRTDFQFSKYGYQYWTRVGSDGAFSLPGVRPGTYRLSAYADGTFGELVIDDVTVGTGTTLDVGDLAWQPPDHGADLWQIGTFDRTATEFRYGADNEFRRYEMWTRYADDFPNDVDFVVGQSAEATDWNFAHWEHVDGQSSPVWDVLFEVGDLPDDRTATLTIAVAGQQGANLRVRVNGAIVENNWDLPLDGSILSRSGIRGAYQSRVIEFASSLLVPGTNTISLAHASPGTSDTEGIIYDALRLEIDVLEGDYNGNRIVDAADYTVWRDHLGQPLLPGDLTPAAVDQHDYDVWKANFGKTQPTPSSGLAVPEPTAAVFAWFATLLCAARRQFTPFRSVVSGSFGPPPGPRDVLLRVPRALRT